VGTGGSVVGAASAASARVLVGAARALISARKAAVIFGPRMSRTVRRARSRASSSGERRSSRSNGRPGVTSARMAPRVAVRRSVAGTSARRTAW